MFTFSSTREDEEKEKDEETEGENCLQLQVGNQSGPREQGPLGRETACYGEHSGLEDFTRDVCVRGVQSGEEQIKPDCVTTFKVFVVVDLQRAFVRTPKGSGSGS